MIGIGILTPYGKHEVTAAALRMASALRSQGASVGVAALGSPDFPVHRDWDQYVMTRTSDLVKFQEWMLPYDNLVWFDPHRVKMELAEDAALRNIVVPMWRNLDAINCTVIEDMAHRVIYPSCAIADHLMDFIDVDATVLHPWDPGLPPVHREIDPLKRLRYFVPIVGEMRPTYCSFVIGALRRLLELDRDAHVTFCTTKQTFPKKCREQLDRLMVRYEGRLEHRVRGSYFQYISWLVDSDWMVWLSLGDNVGVSVLEAFSCGVPVIAFDVPPASELIRDGVNGRLVGCDIRLNGLRVPEAVPDLNQVVEVLEQVAGDQRQLQRYRPHLLRGTNPIAFEENCYAAALS